MRNVVYLAVLIYQTEPICGGFVRNDVNHESTQELAKWVVSVAKKEGRGSYKLVEIIEAESQVVAGTNYGLKLKLAEEQSPDNVAEYSVSVFQGLDGVKRLTGFGKV